MTSTLESTTLGDQLRASLLRREPMSGVRVVDAHAHLGPYSRFFIPEPDWQSMVRLMDRCGVEAACIASHVALELDSAQGNAQTAAAVEASAGRLLGLLALNPHQDPEAQLDQWLDDRRFIGMKLHPDLNEYPITGPRYDAVWDAARDRGMPVLVHTWTGSTFDDPSMFREIAEKHPDVAIMLAHAGATPNGYEVAAQLTRTYPNLYLEICGTFMTSSWLRRLVDVAGADRVIYGSDFPFIDLRYSIGRVLHAGLDDEQLRLVLAETWASLVSPDKEN